jgi:hypothetical protein
MSELIQLVQINALSAHTIRYDLMHFSAKAAHPNGQNGKRESVFAITKISTFFRLFRHCLLHGKVKAFNAPPGLLDAWPFL